MLAWIAVIAGLGVALMSALGGVVSLAFAASRSNNATPDITQITSEMI